jgi:putative transposase
MSRKYKIRNQEEIYFVTFTVIDWIDVFIRDEYRIIVIDSIKYCQREKGLEVYAYCFMTSHIQMIIGTKGINRIEFIIRGLKSFTSRHIRKALEASDYESRKEWMLKRMYQAGKYNSNNKDFQFWQQDSHPIELNSQEIIFQKLDYIHFNPVTAGFVDSPEAWIHSSARDYAGVSRSLIELTYLT